MAAPRAPRIKQTAGPFQSGGDYLIARQVMQAQRRAGATFDEAWQLALKMTSHEDRAILEQTRGAWQCAYNRQAFHSGGAFGQMAAVTVHDGDTESRQVQVVIR
jgi:hypothetical protein